VALALGCLLGTVFGGFGRFWQFGTFVGGQIVALKAHRNPLLWPWPWGACWTRCLDGFGKGFGGWSDRINSILAVVPGAALALAKAGVGE